MYYLEATFSATPYIQGIVEAGEDLAASDNYFPILFNGDTIVFASYFFLSLLLPLLFMLLQLRSSSF